MAEGALTRALMRRQGLTADEAISKYKQASVRRVFPAQFVPAKLEPIENAAASGDQAARRALKLLFGREYDK